MNLPPPMDRCLAPAPAGQPEAGMNLIALLGIMAVLVILAAVLAPSFIRKLDQIASDAEVASLKALGEALESSILRNRYIPTFTNWAQVAAAERGVNLSEVTTNLRRQPRVLWVDPALQIGGSTAGQDYLQDVTGSFITDASGRVVPPRNARMILLSSIGTPLPAGVTNGVPASTNDFDGVWNAANGTLPAGTLWAGWSGARDLRIQRINLAPLFVHVVLTTYASDGEGLFSIDGGAVTNAPATIFGRDAYYIRNSVLRLFTHTNSLDTVQILTRSVSFVYQNNVWRGTIEGLGTVSGMDLGTIVDRFLRAEHNPRALGGTNQQYNVVQSFRAYIQAYLAWEAAGFGNNSLRDTVVLRQAQMMNEVQGLYKNPNYDPPEVACPP